MKVDGVNIPKSTIFVGKKYEFYKIFDNEKEGSKFYEEYNNKSYKILPNKVIWVRLYFKAIQGKTKTNKPMMVIYYRLQD